MLTETRTTSFALLLHPPWITYYIYMLHIATIECSPGTGAQLLPNVCYSFFCLVLAWPLDLGLTD
ncbi:hypothetical protein QBC42DRAFT_280198 [Cladorrhinum samala]|uniref:Uncharacterized protein n=1 Tax=Cladorrhinum samala TaxID=585594 RepID=A0AAV9HAZ2_9PEZI|nr:hypothetical protein QBC42DRAFT_280198 [Cladorrhinum samala]